jgi:hypothetical protein
MHIPFALVLVDQVNNRLIRDSFMKQTSPKNSSILDYFTTDQLSLAAGGAGQALKTAATKRLEFFGKVIENATRVFAD